MQSIADRVKAFYQKVRSETAQEPQLSIYQLTAMELEKPQIRHSCNTCASHGYNLCPIHPMRTYQFTEPNDCPDWEHRKS